MSETRTYFDISHHNVPEEAFAALPWPVKKNDINGTRYKEQRKGSMRQVWFPADKMGAEE